MAVQPAKPIPGAPYDNTLRSYRPHRHWIHIQTGTYPRTYQNKTVIFFTQHGCARKRTHTVVVQGFYPPLTLYLLGRMNLRKVYHDGVRVGARRDAAGHRLSA